MHFIRKKYSMVFLVMALSCSLQVWAAEKPYNEQLFVNTDRDIYIAGENLFFNTLLLNEPFTVNGSLQSGFVYLTLRSPVETVKKKILPLNPNRAHGHFFLHDTLSTGYYELVANTQWMRNQGEESFFRKNILIVNRFDTSPGDRLLMDQDTSLEEVSFYPEGGQLITELTNRVLLKTSGGFDASCRQVHIIDQNRDTVASTKLNRHGFGCFELTPENNKTYRAKIDGLNESFELPASREKGWTMRVKEDGEELKVSIKKAENGKRPDYFTLSQDGETLYRGKPETFPFVKSLPLNDLGFSRGLVTIEAGSNEQQNLKARRLWYHQPEKTREVSISSEKDTFAKREQAEVTLDGSGMSGDFAFLSFSVVAAETVREQNINVDSHARALELARNFGTSYQQSLKTFARQNIEELNTYLLKKTEIKESKAHGPRNFENDHYLESDGIILSGRVTEKESDKPVEKARVILNSPDTTINMVYAYTNEKGKFNLFLNSFYHDKTLYFFVDTKTIESETSIRISDKFSHETSYRSQPFSLSAELFEHIERSQDIVRVNKSYNIERLVAMDEHKPALSHHPLLFSEPNRRLFTDNYVALDSLPEIARELIPSVRIRKTGDGYQTSMICADSGDRMRGEPTFFLDGIILNDIGKLVHLDSEDIDRIDIHNYQWLYGDLHFNGIMGVFTRDGDHHQKFSRRTKTSKIRNTFSGPVGYQTPDYEKNAHGEESVPDFRQLLVWEPDIRIEKGRKKTLKFNTGDIKGDFMIQVQGITSDGEAVNIVKPVSVK